MNLVQRLDMLTSSLEQIVRIYSGSQKFKSYLSDQVLQLRFKLSLLGGTNHTLLEQEITDRIIVFEQTIVKYHFGSIKTALLKKLKDEYEYAQKASQRYEAFVKVLPPVVFILNPFLATQTLRTIFEKTVGLSYHPRYHYILNNIQPKCKGKKSILNFGSISIINCQHQISSQTQKEQINEMLEQNENIERIKDAFENPQQPFLGPHSQQPILGPQQPIIEFHPQQQPILQPHPQQPFLRPQQPIIEPHPQQPFLEPHPQQPFLEPHPQQPILEPHPQQPFLEPHPQQPFLEPHPQQPILEPHPQQPFLEPHPQQPFLEPHPQQPILEPHPQQPFLEPHPQQPILEPHPQQPFLEPHPQQPFLEPHPQKPILEPHPQQPILQPHPQQPILGPQQPIIEPHPQQPILQPHPQKPILEPHPQQPIPDLNYPSVVPVLDVQVISFGQQEALDQQNSQSRTQKRMEIPIMIRVTLLHEDQEIQQKISNFLDNFDEKFKIFLVEQCAKKSNCKSKITNLLKHFLKWSKLDKSVQSILTYKLNLYLQMKIQKWLTVNNKKQELGTVFGYRVK